MSLLRTSQSYYFGQSLALSYCKISPDFRVVLFSGIGVNDKWNGVVWSVVVEAFEEIRDVGRSAAIDTHRYQLLGI